MKRFLLILTLAISSSSFAQTTIKVTKETIQIKGERAEGFEVVLDGTMREVETLLNDYLKPIGKARKVDDAFAISLPLINGKNYTSPLYAVARDKGKGTAWIGIRTSEWPSNVEEVNKDIEKLVYEFGIKFNKNKVQEQIDESTRALQAVERQQQRLVSQNKDLGNKLENNKKEKSALEKSIENNKIQFESLTKRLEQNKKDQDSVALAGEQIKKVIEMQKQRQSNAN